MRTLFFFILSITLFLFPLSLFSQGTDSASRHTSFILTVRSNVDGADVFINGEQRGKSPIRVRVSRGTYTVTVKAEGYYDYSETVRVENSKTVSINLVSPNRARLTVTSNVNGASVFIDNQYRGRVPYFEILTTGIHQVRISAPGHRDFTTEVDLKRTTSIHANLQEEKIKVDIDLPDPNITVFLDGIRIYSSSFEVTPGRHTIQFSLGDIRIQESYDFRQGNNYRIRPRLVIDFDY